MRQRRWSWLRLLAAVAILAGVVGIGLELLLRWFPEHLPAEARFRIHGETVRADGLKSRPHDEIGYLWPPHDRSSFEGLDFGFSYTTDEHGFRNPSPWPEQADVVVLGDSQAFGFGVEDRQAWVRLVGEALPGREVLNLGLIGAAPQQFLRIYERYGAPLRPQVVIVALYPPNALYAARLFEDWLADGKPGRFDMLRSLGGRADAADGWRSVVKSYARQSYLVRGLHARLVELRSDTPPREIAFENGGRVQLLPRLSSAPEPADMELVLDTLLRLQAAVERSGAEMLVVLFPTKEEVHLPLLGPEGGEGWTTPVKPFVAAFDRLGIRYLDLTPILQDRVAQGEWLFFEIDVHPNVKGYRLIADVVADRLQHLTTPGDG